MVQSTSFKSRNFPTIWCNPHKKFTLFKSYNLPTIWFNHSNFLAHMFKIVGIFLQFGSLHIFQSVGIFLQFSSIHILQIVGIFLQFGPIHEINSLFSSRIIFLQFGLIIAIFCTHLSNCRYFHIIQFNPHFSNCRNFPTIWSNSHNKFTIFKSYNLLTIWFNHIKFPAHIHQIVGIFLQFSSIHIFHIVGIFLQFGPIHLQTFTLFKS